MKVGTFLLFMMGVLIFVVACAGLLYYMNSTNDNKSVQDEEKSEIANVKVAIEDESLTCVEIGCPEGSFYVGSINSDKYYSCSCHYAKRINPENLKCFVSDSEAIEMGYIKIDC